MNQKAVHCINCGTLDRAQRSVALISTLFDRLPEIHDRELVMRWEDPEAARVRSAGIWSRRSRRSEAALRDLRTRRFRSRSRCSRSRS